MFLVNSSSSLFIDSYYLINKKLLIANVRSYFAEFLKEDYALRLGIFYPLTGVSLSTVYIPLVYFTKVN